MGAVREEAAVYLHCWMAYKASSGGGEWQWRWNPPEAAKEEEDRDIRDMVHDLAGFSREEEVVAAEPAAEEALARVAAAVAFMAWVTGAGRSWTYLQLFDPPSRRQSRRPCRASQLSPQRQWRNVWQLMTGGEVSPQSCDHTSATSAVSRETSMSPPFGGR